MPGRLCGPHVRSHGFRLPRDPRVPAAAVCTSRRLARTCKHNESPKEPSLSIQTSELALIKNKTQQQQEPAHCTHLACWMGGRSSGCCCQQSQTSAASGRGMSGGSAGRCCWCTTEKKTAATDRPGKGGAPLNASRTARKEEGKWRGCSSCTLAVLPSCMQGLAGRALHRCGASQDSSSMFGQRLTPRRLTEHGQGVDVGCPRDAAGSKRLGGRVLRCAHHLRAHQAVLPAGQQLAASRGRAGRGRTPTRRGARSRGGARPVRRAPPTGGAIQDARGRAAGRAGQGWAGVGRQCREGCAGWAQAAG